MEQLQSHMTNGLLIYGKYLRISSYIRKPFLIYDFAFEENLIFFFISVGFCISFDKTGFQLQIGDHFFLSPNSERSSIMPCALKSSLKSDYKSIYRYQSCRLLYLF